MGVGVGGRGRTHCGGGGAWFHFSGVSYFFLFENWGWGVEDVIKLVGKMFTIK